MNRRQVHVLAGASGSGKTTLLMQTIRDQQQGKPTFIGFHGSKIAYAATDRDSEQLEERIDRWGIKHIEVWSLTKDDDMPEYCFENHKKILEYTVEQFNPGFDLLVLDTSILYIKDHDSNGYGNVAVSLTRMAKVARHYDITIILTHHATKARIESGFKRIQDRISGSAAWQGYSDCQLFISASGEQDKEYSTFVVNPHDAPPHHWKLVWTPEGELKEYDLMEVSTGMTNNASNLVNTTSKAGFVRPLISTGVPRATAYRKFLKSLELGHIIEIGHDLYKWEVKI